MRLVETPESLRGGVIQKNVQLGMENRCVLVHAKALKIERLGSCAYNVCRADIEREAVVTSLLSPR